MQKSIAIEVLAAVSDKGFSLDELVYKVQELFQERGLPGLVALVLRLVDEKIVEGLIGGQDGWKPSSPCCPSPRYERSDHLRRNIRTSIGKVQFLWRRLRCRACGRTTIPLREFLGLAAYQSKSVELERVVAEVVGDQSYRRTSKHLYQIGKIPVPRTTAHRWVVTSSCDEIALPAEKMNVLMADGTGYKRRPKDGKDNKGDLRLALGIDPTGRVRPLGVWSQTAWETIAAKLTQGVGEGQPVAEMLVSDGEPGLPENLGRLTGDQQRCQWHMTHDLDERMRHGSAPKVERRKMQKELAALLEVRLPSKDVEMVHPEDAYELNKAVRLAEEGIQDLINRLHGKGYHEAARYVSYAKDHLFSYVRFWVRSGIVSPRTSSFIERLMREVARRLKRIAFGWSPKGAAQMARIILKRFCSVEEWNDYWKQRMRISDDNVILALRGIREVNPQPLGR
jgi:hypothetical protein